MTFFVIKFCRKTHQPNYLIINTIVKLLPQNTLFLNIHLFLLNFCSNIVLVLQTNCNALTL